MLKIYEINYHVSINNGPWTRLDAQGFRMFEESQVTPERIKWDNISFAECCAELETTTVTGIYLYSSAFKRKPQICIHYAGDWESTTYKHFGTISFKVTCVEATYYTLANIMKYFPADQTIQYLKERGAFMCPMLKE